LFAEEAIMRTIALVAIALAGMSLNTKTQSSRWQRLADIQRCIACSLSAFLPPSPPAEKATARQDQARQASTPETHASKGVLTVEGQHACKRVGD
jgi:hypothetical protein